MCVFCVFFFFKQKTAYEMRISDWSSDVCSSDLLTHRPLRKEAAPRGGLLRFASLSRVARPPRLVLPGRTGTGRPGRHARALPGTHPPLDSSWGLGPGGLGALIVSAPSWCRPRRSEEHTSELQSLMRISYAVFCLKKKTQ